MQSDLSKLSYFKNGLLLAKEVLFLSEQLKILPAIVAGRIQFEKNNYRILSQFMGREEVSKLFASI